MAGIAALYFEMVPADDYNDFTQSITSNSIPMNDGGSSSSWSKISGYGRIDAYSAIQDRYNQNFVTLTINQKNSSDVNVDSAYVWQSNNWQAFKVPKPFVFVKSSTQYFRSKQSIIGGEKYHDWNNSLADVTNHKAFTIPVQSGEFTAHLLPAKNAQICNALEGTSVNGGEIGFQDPWLIDSSDSKGSMNRGANAKWYNSLSSPFSPSTSSNYKGVFLNQDLSFDPNIPNYSVQALQTQNIDLGGTLGTREFYFQSWSSTGASFQDSNSASTGVVFTSPSAVVNANYKGHLISSASSATSGSSQRKTAVWGSSQYAVYESNGSIWFTKNDGSDWSKETKLSLTNNAKNPSIAVSYVTPSVNVHVTWEEYNSQFNFNETYYIHSTDEGETWDDVTPLGAVSGNPAFVSVEEANPAVEADGSAAVVVWRYGDGVTDGGLALAVSPSLSSNIYTITGTDASSQHPSLSYGRRLDGNSAFLAAYEQGTSIYFKEFNVNYSSPYNVTYESSAVLISSSNNPANPSIAGTITSSDKTAAVVWEGLNGTNDRVYYKERNASGVWQSQIEFSHGTHQLSEPSVKIDLASNKIDVLWQCDSHIALKSKTVGTTSWSGVIDLGSGKSPNLSQHTDSYSPAMAVWSTGSSAPYEINLYLFTQQAVSGTISSNTTWSGIINVTGNVTVNNGVTLTISPGSIISFASGTSLTVNGILNAQGNSSQLIIFTSSSGASPSSWGTIKLNGSGASGSTIKYANISYGTQVEALNVSNFEISNCNFTDNYKAVYVNNSSGLISDNYLTSNSIGHSILIENASTVDCIQNIIKKTSPNERRGSGIQYGGGSNGNVWQNDITKCNWGIGAIWGSSPNSYYSQSFTRNNRVTDCDYGLMVYRESYPIFGTPSSNLYALNSVHDNTKNVSVGNTYTSYSSSLTAFKNWWGDYPPNTSLFLIGPNAQFTYTLYRSSDPWSGIPLPLIMESPENTKGESGEVLAKMQSANNEISIQETSLIMNGINLRHQNKYNEAKDFFISYLAEHPDDQRAYVELYNCYSKETSDDLINFFSSLPKESDFGGSKDHKLLLSYLYLRESRNPPRRTEAEREKFVSLAEKTNNEIIEENPNTSLSVRAKINNIYIALFSENNLEKASSIFTEISAKRQLSSSMELADVKDAIEIYAGTFKDGSYNPDSPIIQKDNTLLETPKEYSLLGNYPNPFNPSTTISYNLPFVSEVEVTIYDILGNEVKSFVIPTQNAGTQKIIWSGRNSSGEQVSSGIYLYHFKAVSLEKNDKVFEKSAKFILMK